MSKVLHNAVVIHYGEIALKGRNRSYFENKLRSNIRKLLRGLGLEEIRRFRGRLLISLKDDADREQIQERLSYVFGITHFSFAQAMEADIEKIEQEVWHQLQGKSFDSFRIDARRAEKHFHMNSQEINKRVGAFIQQKCGAKVDLLNPDITGFVELVGRNAFIYTEKHAGLRGLPVGVSEKAVSLLSSGIDSPVASFTMLKRGVKPTYVHFHSQPFTNAASKENTEKLIEVLNRYQLHSKAYFVPFIDIQKEIMAKAPETLRVLLYRRYMVRLAERIAELENASALVTGESVGQVASQTLSNIRVVGEVTSLPILRPLSGYDKEQIVQMAREIGTFEISIQPDEDCCSLFVPRNVETRGRSANLIQAEKQLEMDTLMEEALTNSEVKTFKAYQQEKQVP